MPHQTRRITPPSVPPPTVPKPTPTAPPVSVLPGPSQQMVQLKAILSKYEITIADANDLVVLQNYDIVFLADDSGSMQLCSVPPHERKLGTHMPSRWDELCETMRVVAELACCFDSDGIDIHFLNRAPISNVTDMNDPRVAQSLLAPPKGGTPLTERLHEVLAQYSQSEKPVLIMIATDGEPNGGPSPFKQLIRNALKKSTYNAVFKFQILACTEDDEQVAWLNTFDDQTVGIDVTDDFYSERREVLAAGKVTSFNRSDWVIKALLGPICSKYDQLDQRVPYFPAPSASTAPNFRQGTRQHDDGCCLIM